MANNNSMQSLTNSVYKLNRIMEDLVQNRMIEEGITNLHPTAGIILLPLLERQERTLTELAKNMHVKAPTITVIANRLEDRGWIHRQRDAKDRRKVLLYLTDDGRKTAEKLSKVRSYVVSTMSNGLKPEKIDHARDILEKIMVNIASATK